MGTKTNKDDLDKKLEDICYRMYENSGNSQYIRAEWANKPLHPDEAFRQIKQAFIDEGWQHTDVYPIKWATEKQVRDSMKKGEYHVADYGMKIVESDPLMTKDQWEQQAIKDGWVKIESPEARVDPVRMGNYIQLQKGFMTGQEWYDKFMAELPQGQTATPDEWFDGLNDAVEAAKKAAGIE